MVPHRRCGLGYASPGPSGAQFRRLWEGFRGVPSVAYFTPSTVWTTTTNRDQKDTDHDHMLHRFGADLVGPCWTNLSNEIWSVRGLVRVIFAAAPRKLHGPSRARTRVRWTNSPSKGIPSLGPGGSETPSKMWGVGCSRPPRPPGAPKTVIPGRPQYHPLETQVCGHGPCLFGLQPSPA